MKTQVAGITDPAEIEEENNFYDFFKKVLRIDPLDRLSIEDAMRHPWVTSIINNLKQLQSKSK